MRPAASCSAKYTLSGEGSGTRYSTVVWCDMNWTGSAITHLLPLSALRARPLGPRSLLGGIPASRRSLRSREFEARDVFDVTLGLVGPADADASAGRSGLRRAAVERVQQRRVGAVELHQRPRERTVERVRAQRLGHPGCVLDDTFGSDVDDLRERVAVLGVVFERWYQHLSARGAHADDVPVAQRGEERTDHR